MNCFSVTVRKRAKIRNTTPDPGYQCESENHLIDKNRCAKAGFVLSYVFIQEVKQMRICF